LRDPQRPYLSSNLADLLRSVKTSLRSQTRGKPSFFPAIHTTPSHPPMTTLQSHLIGRSLAIVRRRRVMDFLSAVDVSDFRGPPRAVVSGEFHCHGEFRFFSNHITVTIQSKSFFITPKHKQHNQSHFKSFINPTHVSRINQENAWCPMPGPSRPHVSGRTNLRPPMLLCLRTMTIRAGGAPSIPALPSKLGLRALEEFPWACPLMPDAVFFCPDGNTPNRLYTPPPSPLNPYRPPNPTLYPPRLTDEGWNLNTAIEPLVRCAPAAMRVVSGAVPGKPERVL